MSKVILVGNGFSSKEHELGELIDSYDTVVRFNWYQTKGREKYIGSKTDIWFTTVFDPVRVKANNRIFLHSWTWGKRYCPLFQKFKDSDLNLPRLGKTFNRLLFDIRRFINEKNGRVNIAQAPGPEYQVFSTLALAAWWIIYENKKKYCTKSGNPPLPDPPKIDLYGVDWWLMSQKNFQSDDAFESAKSFNPKLELELFSFLHQEGLIRDLHPDSDFHKFYE